MTIYVCGYKLSGDYFELSIDNTNEVDSIRDSNVVMILNSSADNKLTNYYTAVRSLVRNGNNLVIINDENNKSKIRKAICMLAVSLGCYNIYDCAMSDLDVEYIKMLVTRKASQLEIEEYIGADIAAYEQAAEILIKMQDCAKNNDSEGLSELLAYNKEIVYNIPVVMDFLKSVYDTHVAATDVKVDKIQKVLDEALKDLDKAKERAKDSIIKVKSQEEELNKLRISEETIKKDLASAYKKNADLEKQISEMSDSEFGSSYSLSYTAINTSQIRAFSKYVVYFKDINDTLYSRSMLKCLRSYFELEEKTAKLIIYDRAHDFMAIYKDCTIVNGEKLSKNPDLLKNSKNIIIVTDTNMGVLNAVLQMDADILIIWDRLKNKEDLVEGSLVTKFYFFGDTAAVRDIENSTGKSYPRDRIFVNQGSNTTLYIPKIDRYESFAPISQVSNYATASIQFGDKKILLFDFILEQCGISTGKI